MYFLANIARDILRRQPIEVEPVTHIKKDKRICIKPANLGLLSELIFQKVAIVFSSQAD